MKSHQRCQDQILLYPPDIFSRLSIMPTLARPSGRRSPRLACGSRQAVPSRDQLVGGWAPKTGDGGRIPPVEKSAGDGAQKL